MSSHVLNPMRWRALGILALAQFLVIMDTSIIGVALPGLSERWTSASPIWRGSSPPM